MVQIFLKSALNLSEGISSRPRHPLYGERAAFVYSTGGWMGRRVGNVLREAEEVTGLNCDLNSNIHSIVGV